MKISLCNFSVAYESRFPHTCLCVEDPFRFRIFHSVSNDVTDASLSITTNRRRLRKSNNSFLPTCRCIVSAIRTTFSFTTAADKKKCLNSFHFLAITFLSNLEIYLASDLIKIIKINPSF